LIQLKIKFSILVEKNRVYPKKLPGLPKKVGLSTQKSCDVYP
jgi:hypothetical protein